MDEHVLMYIIATVEAYENRKVDLFLDEDISEYYETLCCLHLDADTYAELHAEIPVSARSDDLDIPF